MHRHTSLSARRPRHCFVVDAAEQSEYIVAAA
jgi:hypothetical protein